LGINLCLHDVVIERLEALPLDPDPSWADDPYAASDSPFYAFVRMPKPDENAGTLSIGSTTRSNTAALAATFSSMIDTHSDGSTR
jgi:hypothetical protein